MFKQALSRARSWPATALLCGLTLVLAASAFLLVSGGPAPKPVLYRLPELQVRAGFPKWGAVLDRDWARDAAFGELCRERVGRPCNLTTWRRFLETVRDAPFADRIAAVNGFVNAVRYREDQALWGAGDYWAAPGEFFARGGDCEDFAIAKYWSLRALGVPAERLRIVVLQDVRRDLPHAVLAVRWAGPELVLDNLSDDVRVWPELGHYLPVYSVNETRYEIVRRRNPADLLQSAGS